MPPEVNDESRELLELREEFDRELIRRAFQIGELERELVAVRQTYETSISWRITRPLRAAMALLRGAARR